MVIFHSYVELPEGISFFKKYIIIYIYTRYHTCSEMFEPEERAIDPWFKEERGCAAKKWMDGGSHRCWVVKIRGVLEGFIWFHK